MTPEEFAQKMQEITDAEEKVVSAIGIAFMYHNTEYAHKIADNLMGTLLKSLGYGDGIEIFEEMEKWYA